MAAVDARGWEPHPDFSTYSNDRLKLQEALINENIQWSEEAGDPLRATYYRQQMRALQAERVRRNGGGVNSFPHLGEKTVRNKFQPQSWGEFVAMDFGGQPYTIQDLLPDQGLSVLHGRGKEQKSTLIIHMCRAVATGEPFLCKPTCQKKVLYLNYEMPPQYLQTLLKVNTPEDAYLLDRPVPILTLEIVDYLLQTFIPGGLLVIDSFRGAFRLHGDAENSAGGAGVILRGLQDIALKHKALIKVIHHRNRSQGREGTDAISGTSDWIAAPDIIWSWTRLDKDKPGTLMVEGRMAPIDPLSVIVTPEECIYQGSVKESQERTDRQAILDALSEEGQGADAISQTTALPPGTVRARLESLHKNGLVSRDGEGKRGSPFLWSKLIPHAAQPYSAETNPRAGNGHPFQQIEDTQWTEVPEL